MAFVTLPKLPRIGYCIFSQDAANAVMGIVVHHIEPYTYWKPSLIDAILKYGDRLYTMSIHKAKNPPYLKPIECAEEFHVTSFNVSHY